MSQRHPVLRAASYALPLILVIAGCVFYARYASTRFPNGELRDMPSPVARASEKHLVRLEPLKTLRLPDSALNLNAEGPVLYAAMTGAGLATIDLSNPADPELVAHVTAPPAAEGEDEEQRRQYVLNAFRVGDKLIVLDRVRGLVVHDATDPLHPVVEWSKLLPGPPGAQAIDLLHAGESIFLACGGAGLAQMPAQLTPETEPRYLLNRFDHTTDVAFMPPHWIAAADGRMGGIQIVSVEDMDQPRPLGNVTTWPLYMDNISILDRHVFASTRGDNVMVAFNLGNPGQPYLSSFFRNPYSSITCITEWKDRYVVLGNNFEFIEVFDALDPEAPRAVAVLSIPGRVSAIHIRDDILYVSLWEERRIEVYRLIEDESLRTVETRQT